MGRTVLGIAIGVVVSVALLEGVLWLLPTYNGIFAADPDPEWPVHHLEPTQRYTYSAGWDFRNPRRGAINRMGYVAPFEFEPMQGAVALFGDSYMEAVMNWYEDTVSARLADVRGVDRKSVLNFGIASSALPDYLGLGPYVRDRFAPEWIVIFVGDGDFAEGFRSRTGHFRWSSDSLDSVELVPDVLRPPLVKFLRRVGIIRYMRANLRFNPRNLFSAYASTEEAPAQPRCRETDLRDDDQARLRSFVAALPAAYGVDASRIVFLRDSEDERRSIYGVPRERDARCPPSREDRALALLMDEAQRIGMSVVDTAPLFRAHFETTGERVDYSPIDWHWNAVGHGVAAQALRDVMERVSRESAY